MLKKDEFCSLQLRFVPDSRGDSMAVVKKGCLVRFS